jgi:hypothetical protein
MCDITADTPTNGTRRGERIMRETRRADQMLPGFHVRFPTNPDIYTGTIAATRPIQKDRIDFTFEDTFLWTFLNSDLFHRDWPDDEADAHADADADEPVEFESHELVPVPA